MLDDIPKEIYEAARKIDLFFKMRGIEKWEFLNIRSRVPIDPGICWDPQGNYICKPIKCGDCGKFIADKDLSKSYYHFTPDSACTSEESYYTCSRCKG